MKRLFIGFRIDYSESLGTLYNKMKEKLADERIKWVDTTGIHVTLAFLGSMDESKIPEIGRVIEESCGKQGAFDVELAGVGVFKKLTDPRILWVGMENYQQVMTLRERLVSALGEAGLFSDNRPFRPHVTLGRPKGIADPDRVKKVLDEVKGITLAPQKVSEIILFESRLKPAGPVYLDLLKVKLS